MDKLIKKFLDAYALVVAYYLVFVELPVAMFLFNHVTWPIKVRCRRLRDEWVRPLALFVKIVFKGYLREDRRRKGVLLIRRFRRMEGHLTDLCIAELRRQVYEKTALLQQELGTRVNLL